MKNICKKNNGNKLTPIDIDNELSPEANITEKHNILEANQLLGSNNMEIMVNMATSFNFLFLTHPIPEDENGIFLFSTFTGITDCGHWHLTIIKNLETHNMDI